MPNIQLVYTYITIISCLFVGLPLLLRLRTFRTGAFIYFYQLVQKIELYVALANTLIHELSHGLVAIATGGSVHKITLHRDTSGLAVTKTRRSRVVRALVSYAGYTGSSLAAVGLFYLLHQGQYERILLIFLGIAAVTALLWVRNVYGFLWALSFVAAIGYIVYEKQTTVIMHTSIFLSVVVLIDSITSAWTVCWLSIRNRHEAGDATSLAQATWIPAAIWGLLFFGQAVYAGYCIYQIFLS